jgi:hypothetical protein
LVPLNVGDIVLEVKTRGEELMAISETMKILDDDAESFRKALPPISFLQAVRETSRNWTPGMPTVGKIKKIGKG